MGAGRDGRGVPGEGIPLLSVAGLSLLVLGVLNSGTGVLWGASVPGPGGWGPGCDSVVDGGEQGGVGADQRGADQQKQRAVGLAALADPLIG